MGYQPYDMERLIFFKLRLQLTLLNIIILLQGVREIQANQVVVTTGGEKIVISTLVKCAILAKSFSQCRYM